MGSNGEFADAEIGKWLASQPEMSAEMDVAAMRRAGAQAAREVPREPHVAGITDIDVAGLSARLYRPRLDRTPLILYLHGGGWTVGSVEGSDHLCRRLARRSGLAVLALEYRLAPEHPWPASIDDSVAALSWIADGRPELGAIGRVAVAGDSAGGALATLACLQLRDSLPAALPALQVLLYPNTDLSGAQPSMREKAHGYGLSAEAVRFFNRQWVADDALWSDPRVSPLHAPELAGLPQALIVTAEHDPLRDEGEAYAERLIAAGVMVTRRREPGLVHNFMRMDQVSPTSAAAADRVADEIAALLAN